MRPSLSLLQKIKPPVLWQRAVQQLPAAKILPLKLGGEVDQRFAAWKGDKRLGAAAVEAMTRYQGHEDEHSPGSATALASLALSNSFFAYHSSTILPGYDPQVQQLSDREVGTLLEAAVDRVHEEIDPEAVLDLASFLVQEAAARASNTPINSKGLFLSLGGTVETRQMGGSDHAPVFEATATLRDHTALTTAGSKKKAEQQAAQEILARLGLGENDTDDEDARIVDLSSEQTFGIWENTTMGPEHQALRIKSGESRESWWLRGAMIPKDSFRRATLAPAVFPEVVVAVDAFTRASPPEQEDEMCAVFLVITTHSQPDEQLKYHVTPVCEGPSNSQARKNVGILANKLIAEALSIELPPLSDDE